MFTYKVECALTEGQEIMNAEFMFPEAALRTAATLAKKYEGQLAYCNVELMENGMQAATVIKYGPYAYLFVETFLAPEKYPNALLAAA